VLATCPKIPVAAAGAVMLAGVRRVVGVPNPYVADPMRLGYIWEAEEALYAAKAMACG